MKRFRPAKLTTRFHSRDSKKTCRVPVTVKAKNVATSVDESIEDNNSVEYSVPEEPVARNRASQHELRSIASLNNWADKRPNLMSAFLDGNYLPSEAKCFACDDTAAIIRCIQCGPQVFYCKSCCLKYHSKINIFHTPEVWKDGTFVPFIMMHDQNTLQLPFRKIFCKCNVIEKRNITVIDIQGNHHFKQIETCACEKVAVTLLRYGLWPGSPEKPAVAFTLELMELLRVVFVHCKVSLNEMTEVLDITRHKLIPKLALSLYSTLNSGCFEEYRLFYHQVHNLHSIDQRLYDGTWCPMCPQDDGVLVQSMDACFGLYRKKCKGSSGVGDRRHKNSLFADQDDVDNFINNYVSSTEENSNSEDVSIYNKECNNFHAGEVATSLRSKGKNKLLDEKAVFGRVCRHDFPKGFLNIKHGERISYSVYECKRILDEVKGKPNLSVIIMYDIACILDIHIKRNTTLNDLASLTLAIPIFHCYGHKGSCQVQYSPRRTKSIGLTDGEGTERLWAFLRDYSRITKEMGTHKRTDVLTDGLIHYGQQLLAKQAYLIKGRIKRANALKEKTTKELNDIIASLPTTFSYSSNTMDALIKQEHEELKSKKQGPLTWDEKYVDLLTQHNRTRHAIESTEDADEGIKLQKKLSRSEKSLQSIEKKNGIKNRWSLNCQSFVHSSRQLISKRREESLLQIHSLASERTFLLELKKKYADGQAVAKKISKTIERSTSSLKKELSRHNALRSPGMNNREITFDDAKNPLSGIYASFHIEPSTFSLPNSQRRKLIDAHCVRERCEEEVHLLKSEVERLISFYHHQLSVLDEVVGSTEHDGVQCLMKRKKLVISQVIYQLKAILSCEFPDADFRMIGVNFRSYELSSDSAFIFPTSYSVTAELDENNIDEIFERYESDHSLDDTSGEDDTSLIE